MQKRIIIHTKQGTYYDLIVDCFDKISNSITKNEIVWIGDKQGFWIPITEIARIEFFIQDSIPSTEPPVVELTPTLEVSL